MSVNAALSSYNPSNTITERICIKGQKDNSPTGQSPPGQLLPRTIVPRQLLPEIDLPDN